jgi:hypothetical protein
MRMSARMANWSRLEAMQSGIELAGIEIAVPALKLFVDLGTHQDVLLRAIWILKAQNVPAGLMK